MEKVTILGAGNGGVTMAYDLTMRGVEVLLWAHPEHSKNLNAIQERGGIEAVEKIQNGTVEVKSKLCGFAKVQKTTTSLAEAFSFSDVILMMVPAFAQEDVFKLAIPHLQDGHLIVLLPGNFGSLVLSRILQENNCHKKILLAETNSIPHACRVVGPAQIIAIGIKKAIYLATLPGYQVSTAVERLSDFFPCGFHPDQNVLKTGLSNMNPMIHPATAALNMGVFETREGQFFFYKEGISDSVAKVLEKIDEERVTVARHLNIEIDPFLENLRKAYQQTAKSFRDFVLTTSIHNAFGYDAPKESKHRYVHEDIPYGLVPLYHLASLVEVHLPAVQSIITLGSIYNDIDYFKKGRTLTNMGLSRKSPAEVLQYVH